jgi:hypothetical protein
MFPPTKQMPFVFADRYDSNVDTGMVMLKVMDASGTGVGMMK